MLRCVDIGIGIADLELITIGTVLDMYTAVKRDRLKEDTSEDASEEVRPANQADFDAF